MISCPNCHHFDMDGAIFCSECGAQLIGTPVSQAAFRGNHIGATPKIDGVSTEAEVGGVFLQVVDSNVYFPLQAEQEYILGRSGDDNSYVPDISLGSVEAYAKGVSRRHACIKWFKGVIMVRDLGSANGTTVNGKKLKPGLDYLLENGDRLALGKMEIQIMINRVWYHLNKEG